MVKKRSGSQLFRILNRLGFFIRLLFFFNVLLALFTFAGYVSIHISPAKWWFAGFFTLSIPVSIVLHSLLFLIWFARGRSRKMLVSFVVLLAGFPLLQRTFTVHNIEKIPPETKTFEVMSYNARLFNRAAFYEKKSRKEADEIINWTARHPAEIKCVQEFFNLDKSSVLNALDKLTYDVSYQYFITSKTDVLRAEKGYLGIAIFSKFPIIKTGEIIFERRSVNKGIFADVKIKDDTLRIFNIHLASNHINPDSLLDDTDSEELKREYKNAFERLKKAFSARGKQVALIEQAIMESPHPVILCGDFNDTPYSYAYQHIRKYLNNAFEEKGNGFGFTHQSKFFFLRIDNQFYDQTLNIHTFKTHDEVKFSDHFPVTARYSLADKVTK
ncbi:MAG: endonuclease/exonuclease/phosphatase family protein [Verrucomicrobia bacterium]|nr:endonuclease/exonuclease/phosphatase family protein [Cytophagales bacterium]